MSLQKIRATKRFKIRYEFNDCTINLTDHAIERAEERNIDIEEKLKEIAGLPLSKYKEHGVIADYYKMKKFLTIITFFKPIIREA